MAWCCVYRGLIVGFLLLQYSVVYAVESFLGFISLLNLNLHYLVDDAYGLGISQAKETYICLDPLQK